MPEATAIRPEKQLLLCCARTRLDCGAAARIRALVCGGLDWAYLLAAAGEHGVVPLLSRQLQAACPQDVPPPWREELRKEFQRNTARNLFLTSELLRILQLFQDHAVTAIPYKGPALAALAYGNMAFRQFGDLDIVVRQRDAARAYELLAADGYRADVPPPDATQQIPGQYQFIREAGKNVVELHTERTLRYFPTPLDLEQLCGRLEPVSLGGRDVLTFSAEDALPMLCVHASKHFWERIAWIADIAELSQIPRGVNWAAAAEQARRLGAERMMHLGLHLASELLGAGLPEEMRRRVQADHTAVSLAAQVRGQLLGESGALPGAAQRLAFRLRMRGSFWEGVRYCFRLATAPTEEDWSVVRLSGPLRPLYAALRPIRLLRKYGLGLPRDQAARQSRPGRWNSMR